MSAWEEAVRTGNRGNEQKLQVDRSVPLSGTEKTKRIELGLAILEAISRPGMTWTVDEIAVFAGCTRSAIWQTEKRALRKCWRRMERIIRELDGRSGTT